MVAKVGGAAEAVLAVVMEWQGKQPRRPAQCTNGMHIVQQTVRIRFWADNTVAGAAAGRPVVPMVAGTEALAQYAFGGVQTLPFLRPTLGKWRMRGTAPSRT